MTINELIETAGTNAANKGFHSVGRTFGDVIALIHTELSEAFEDHRDGKEPDVTEFDENGKPVGIPVELADVLIRVADLCYEYGIDLTSALESKMLYNVGRQHMHGKGL